MTRAIPALVLLLSCLCVCGVSLRAPGSSGPEQKGRARSLERPLPERSRAPLFDPQVAERLEERGRDEWQHPGFIVRKLRLRAGETVADIGAGSGYLLPHLSRAVGEAGRVYAQDVQPAFVAMLRKRAASFRNVTVVLGQPERCGLPSRSVDCFVLLTTYHEVTKPVELLRDLRQAARPSARLAIIDFDALRRGGPPVPAEHEIPEEYVIDEAAQAGWRLANRHDQLSNQFFLVFR
jgi:SAM-dependent methyltransferase